MSWFCPACGRRFEELQARCPDDGWPPVEDLAGHVLAGRYELQKLIGVGGMGSTVWRATQAPIERAVAVKLLPPAKEAPARRFAREARIASHLNHPHIVTIHDYGQSEGGKLYLVMEYLQGKTLQYELKKVPRLPPDRALHVADQVLRALEQAHDQNVVHRDLKPGNLFLTRHNEDRDYVKVLDFGLAKYVSDGSDDSGGDFMSDLDVTGQRNVVCGTPNYMAPEQLLCGRVDHRTDIYSMGVILFRMLTGRLPFEGQTDYELYRQVVSSPTPRFADVAPDEVYPEGLEAIVHRALAKLATERFQGVRDMRLALQAIRHSLGYTSRESSNRFLVLDHTSGTRDGSDSFASPQVEIPDAADLSVAPDPPSDSVSGHAEAPARPRWGMVVAGALLGLLAVGAFAVVDRWGAPKSSDGAIRADDAPTATASRPRRPARPDPTTAGTARSGARERVAAAPSAGTDARPATAPAAAPRPSVPPTPAAVDVQPAHSAPGAAAEVPVALLVGPPELMGPPAPTPAVPVELAGPPDEAAPPASVTVHLGSTPENAEVRTQTGAVLGRTPLTVTLARERHTLTVAAAGRSTATLELNLTAEAGFDPVIRSVVLADAAPVKDRTERHRHRRGPRDRPETAPKPETAKKRAAHKADGPATSPPASAPPVKPEKKAAAVRILGANKRVKVGIPAGPTGPKGTAPKVKVLEGSQPKAPPVKAKVRVLGGG